MDNISQNFIAALKYELDKHRRGSKTRLAGRLEISPGRLADYLNGRVNTSEEMRRRTADLLGYGGPLMYDAFIQRGREILAGETPTPVSGAGVSRLWSEEREELDSFAERIRNEERARLLKTGAVPAPMGSAPTDTGYMSAEEMEERGFIAVPFSDNMKLAAGAGGTIAVTDDEESSPVIVHGPSLGRRNAKGLQAFRVGGDSMEPLIAQNGIVMADIRQNNIMQIKDGGIYVLCWDREDGECAVKRLRWAEKGQWLSIESIDPYYAPVIRRPADVILIGPVIWAWREFKA